MLPRQFARLLAEIRAIGLTDEQMRGLSESMELPPRKIERILMLAKLKFEADLEGRPVRVYHCGGCEQLHAANFMGDCRQDDARFNPEDLDDTLGEEGVAWEEI